MARARGELTIDATVGIDRRQVLCLIARLLEYPDAAWWQALPAFRDAVRRLSNRGVAAHLDRFLDQAEIWGSDALCDHCVQTFDFGRATNLYLTYGQYGEQRERGRALLALKERYERAGFAMCQGELPDYLPLVLEFASCAPDQAAEEVLVTFQPAIARIHSGLREIDSPYACVLRALRMALAALESRPHDVGEDDPCADGINSCGASTRTSF